MRQYHDTRCILCGKVQLMAMTENVICNACENTSEPADEIMKLRKALEPFASPDLYAVLGGNCDGVESVVFARKDTELKIKHFLAAAVALIKHY